MHPTRENIAVHQRRHHSSLSTVLLCLSLVGLVVVFATPYLISFYSVAEEASEGARIIAICGLAGLVVAMYATSRRRTYRVCLLVFAGISMLHTLLQGEDLVAFTLLVVIGIVNVILYEEYPRSYLFCTVYVLGMSGSLALSLWRQSSIAWLVVLVPLVAVAVGTLLSYLGSEVGKLRNELVAESVVSRRLADNVAKLAQANVSSLSIAASAEGESRTEERRRVAQEIHDLVGYTLTTNITLMEAVKLMAKSDPSQIPEYVETLRRNSEVALEEIRSVLHALHSKEDRLDLVGLLMKLRKIYTFSTGVQVEFELGNARLTSIEPFRSLIYHFIREALINAFRHGEATVVTVFFWQRSHKLEVTVQDNGVGASSFEEDIGIAGMRERAAAVDGEISVPRLRTGFEIRLTIPTGEDEPAGEDAIAHS